MKNVVASVDNWFQTCQYKRMLAREHIVRVADGFMLLSSGFWSKKWSTPHVAMPTIDGDEVLSQIVWDSVKQRRDGSTYYRLNTESIPKGNTTWVII